MRAIEQIPHERMRIVIHSWNGKWIVEFEAASYKQTIKIDQEQLPNVNDIKKLLNQDFLNNIEEQFQQLHKLWTLNYRQTLNPQ
ncbi:MAG: hypothetical protein RL092_580 [Bacteroidota bacterium]|jgi:ATP-dependent phosphoenolpyruvate carboxykinase